ncbi:MAG TPA: hypothetical protein VEQ42_10475 [Pyrinomonadaceae bacterium]|nr:hypothetical protein [Pyrinomonadaceae bacterium]
MSVIGRLDPQVEDVLIKPASERRPAARKVPEPAPPAREPAAPTPPEKEAERDESERRELPVWLL